MLTFLIILFTVALILDCLFLGLLILVQLPKKDAGVGMAFGGGAADALFGAGSGNTLTKLTKWSAGIFFALVFLLSSLNIRASNSNKSKLREVLSSQPAQATQPQAQPTPAPTVTGSNASAGSNAPIGLMPLTPTNAAPPATNAVTNAPK
jgi:preprotein translocase subunit SecG